MKMRHLLLLILFLACTATARAAELKVESTQLQRDDGKGEPGEVVTGFHTTDRKLHFHAQLAELKLGKTEARWVITGIDTEAGKDLKVAEFTTSGLISNEINGSVKLPRDWPAGTFRAVLFLNGTEAAHIDYAITRDLSAAKFTTLKLLRDDGKGNAGAEVKAFVATDRKLHFELPITGMPAGATVLWGFRAVDTTGGKNIRVGVTKAVTFDQADASLTANIELPRDWPVGSYEAIVVADRKEFARLPFRIEAAAK